MYSGESFDRNSVLLAFGKNYIALQKYAHLQYIQNIFGLFLEKSMNQISLPKNFAVHSYK